MDSLSCRIKIRVGELPSEIDPFFVTRMPTAILLRDSQSEHCRGETNISRTFLSCQNVEFSCFENVAHKVNFHKHFSDIGKFILLVYCIFIYISVCLLITEFCILRYFSYSKQINFTIINSISGCTGWVLSLYFRGEKRLHKNISHTLHPEGVWAFFWNLKFLFKM